MLDFPNNCWHTIYKFTAPVSELDCKTFRAAEALQYCLAYLTAEPLLFAPDECHLGM